MHQVEIHFRAPRRTVHICGTIVCPHDITPENVAALVIPDVRVVTAVHQDVVFDHAAKPLAVLDAAAQTKVVRDGVIRRTVVEVNVPAVIAAPAIVGEYDGFHRVEQRQFGNLLHPRVDFADVGPPETVASP